ncbi:EAL domain-containing protein [Actinoplanes aureus]|uniref:EAL domain-containing protein n=1 Tax=Actinoplanes aureus TaxID=2792083 RepID=A0A931CAK5_9ACTN|nr:EAL domain-containing protein [Actinoplanes aureus]MBG0563066.1 EAL domain-containing protein [Actinoplanes aureus]
MTVPEERERWTPMTPTTLPEPRQPADDRAAWFTYTAAGDQIVWSAALSAMLGRPPAEKEMTRQILSRYVHRDDHAKALGSITDAWTSRNTVHTTVRLMRADGGWFDVDCRLEPMMSPDGTVRGIRGTVRDVSTRERARRESARLTRRGETVQASLVEPDPATGLLIRAGFADEVDRTLRRSGGALLVVRIQGPNPGEGVRPERSADLLHQIARLLEEHVRPEHLLGRVGPNEVAVLFADTSWRDAREQARNLMAALREQTLAWGGLVRFERDAEAGSHGLLIDAEQAWRQSREADRALTRLAHPVPVRDRQGTYRSRVADALGTDRFTLYSQPILELQTNKVTRHELLLRVLDEADGPQSPIQVLDAAERLDAVFDIDLWVVERAMRLAADEPGLCLQVNLSGRSVGDPRLTTEVEKLLDRYGVDPAQLTFEITETALIGNLSEARRFADRVRDLGCGLALDDFGSGYASFRYLRLFPIDLVKIDGEYVVDLVDNPQDQVLVRALVQVCQAYGIHTVAEFVQDEATLRMLRELGVDYVQGYLIGRPSPVPPGRLRSA